jgi:hypothetical protein
VSGATDKVVLPADAGRRASERPPATGWHRWVPWVLIVLATIIALVAALNLWVKRQALSTDNWTNASSQLLADPEIRNAISVYMVNQLYDNVDVGQALEERLPPATKPLGPTIAGALEPALVQLANNILARPRLQELWKQANRRAHRLLIALLDGKHELLVSTNGNVVLDLRPLLNQFVEQTGLGERVVAKLPPDAGQLVVLKGNQLDAARKAVKVIRVLSFLLTFVVLAMFALAVYLAHGRRRKMLLAAGSGILIVGLIVLVVRRLAGNYLVDALTNTADQKVPVSHAWAIGTELLRNVGINALIYGILVVFAAWVAGPARPAVWLRRQSAPTMRDRPVVVYGLLSVVLLIVLLAGPTDSERIYPLLVLFALAFVGLEVLRRQTMREFPAASVPGGP